MLEQGQGVRGEGGAQGSADQRPGSHCADGAKAGS